MSEENVEVVGRVFEATARGDAATILALYDPEVEWDSSRFPLTRLVGGSGVYRGHDGLRAWFSQYYDAWEHIDHDHKELIDAGDHVISVSTERARGRVSGIEIEADYAAVWTIREGKIVRVVWFPTRAEALEAAGVSE